MSMEFRRTYRGSDMPLYECSICHAAENTALTNFWEDLMHKRPALCSECDPRIGKWHEQFPKITAEEYDAKFPEHPVEYRLSGRSILEGEARLLRTEYFEPLLESSPPPLTHLESTDIPVANDKARQAVVATVLTFESPTGLSYLSPLRKGKVY